MLWKRFAPASLYRRSLLPVGRRGLANYERGDRYQEASWRTAFYRFAFYWYLYSRYEVGDDSESRMMTDYSLLKNALFSASRMEEEELVRLLDEQLESVPGVGKHGIATNFEFYADHTGDPEGYGFSKESWLRISNVLVPAVYALLAGNKANELERFYFHQLELFVGLKMRQEGPEALPARVCTELAKLKASVRTSADSALVSRALQVLLALTSSNREGKLNKNIAMDEDKFRLLTRIWDNLGLEKSEVRVLRKFCNSYLSEHHSTRLSAMRNYVFGAGSRKAHEAILKALREKPGGTERPVTECLREPSPSFLPPLLEKGVSAWYAGLPAPLLQTVRDWSAGEAGGDTLRDTTVVCFAGFAALIQNVVNVDSSAQFSLLTERLPQLQQNFDTQQWDFENMIQTEEVRLKMGLDYSQEGDFTSAAPEAAETEVGIEDTPNRWKNTARYFSYARNQWLKDSGRATHKEPEDKDYSKLLRQRVTKSGRWVISLVAMLVTLVPLIYWRHGNLHVSAVPLRVRLTNRLLNSSLAHWARMSWEVNFVRRVAPVSYLFSVVYFLVLTVMGKWNPLRIGIWALMNVTLLRTTALVFPKAILAGAVARVYDWIKDFFSLSGASNMTNERNRIGYVLRATGTGWELLSNRPFIKYFFRVWYNTGITHWGWENNLG